MNPGTFIGPGTGVAANTVGRYIQTPTISTSQTIPVPAGVKRIEALLVGGGGGGSAGGNIGGGGGGFGGAGVFEIPITGQPLVITVGAGGAVYNAGSPTSVSSANTKYAEIGGGGNGADLGAVVAARGARSGGGGGGGTQLTDPYRLGGSGGSPPIGMLLWSPYPAIGDVTTISNNPVYSAIPWSPAGSGPGGTTGGYAGNPGSLGGGGGGGYGGGTNVTAGIYGGGGGGSNNANGAAGHFGGGGGGGTPTGGAGGSLTSVSIWGYTGFAGGTTTGGGGGGGGGMLAAGSNSTTGAGANGGNGGGGGGGSGNAGGGTGGNGFAVIRFYL